MKSVCCLAFALVLLCGGCTRAVVPPVVAPGGVTTPVMPLKINLGNYSTVSVVAESKLKEDIEPELGQLEQQVIWEVKNLETFDEVMQGTGSETSKDMFIIKLSVVGLKSAGESMVGSKGRVPSQASIQADVSFIDVETGDTIGSYSITGNSPMSSKSETKQAIDEMAKQVKKIVVDNSQESDREEQQLEEE